MNYEIIKCQRSLEQFLRILPELNQGESFFIILQARSKYFNAAKGDPVLYRGSGKSINHIVELLKKLEVKKGLYTTRNREPIDNSALVSYIKMNPRSYSVAQFKSVEKIASNLSEFQKENNNKLFKAKHKIKAILSNFDSGVNKKDLEELDKILSSNSTKLENPQSHSLTALQDSVSRRIIVDVDIDIKEGSFMYDKLYSFLTSVFIDLRGVNSIIKTRGGYHIQLKLDDNVPNNWLDRLRNEKPDNVVIEMNKDSFTPIPGTLQGGSEVLLLMANIDGEVRLTGQFWQMIDRSRSIILDPDGWDRTDYTWSFARELISLMEYANRKLNSTSIININN